MATPMTAAIPPGLDLGPNYRLQFTALDPTTGAVNTSVVISSAFLVVDNIGGSDLSALADETAPLWLDLPNDLVNPADGG